MSDRRLNRRAPLRVMGAVALAAAALVLNCAVSQDAAPPGQARGTPHQVVFTRYAPLLSNAEILRRLFSPLAREAIRDLLARTHKELSPYPLDLAQERFLVYVPTAPPPPSGYALLVFVPPWEEADLPSGWASQLDRYGVVFVTPANAGNAKDVTGRRVPLALAAEENIVREYPIDTRRIYIGGFSGGSRVALRVALGYPDVFHGALLDAGADPVGAYPLPPHDLFLLFQRSSHLVYVTGELDTVNGNDASSSRSMQEWCVFDVETHITPFAGHQALSSAAFGRALDRLLSPAPPDQPRLRACRSHIQSELEEQLSRAQALVSQGDHAAARKLLLEIDKRYGGLAAPRILQLARSCGCDLARP